MRTASRPQGFTLIELLTVIAIIAVLAAILFPVAGTVREQARAGDCMSKLHQIWVSATMYKMDEGAYPPSLMGYAEIPAPYGVGQAPYATVGSAAWVNADQVINGFLYPEIVKDANVFRCPDNTPVTKSAVTIAHFPPMPDPKYWPACRDSSGAPVPCPYIANDLASLCGTDVAGTVDCFTDGPLKGQPKLYYVWDSYDIGPRIDPATGRPVTDAGGNTVFDVHYSRDWTGPSATGGGDWPAQLKYGNPPSDKTLLAYCTYHAATARATTATAIGMAGSAKKVDLKLLAQWGPNLFNR